MIEAEDNFTRIPWWKSNVIVRLETRYL